MRRHEQYMNTTSEGGGEDNGTEISTPSICTAPNYSDARYYQSHSQTVA